MAKAIVSTVSTVFARQPHPQYAPKYLSLELLEKCLVDPAGNLHFKESQAAQCLCHQVGQLVGPQKIYGIYELHGVEQGTAEAGGGRGNVC
ncbi:hypothetical protein ACLKA6_005107 [Drosophila palustris]